MKRKTLLLMFFLALIQNEDLLIAKKLKNFFFLNTALHYGSSDHKRNVKDKDQTVEYNTRNTILNLTTGFVWRYALIGVKYYNLNSQSEDQINTSKTKDKVSSLGATLGFRSRFIQITYSHMNLQVPKKTSSTGATASTYKGERGSIIDFSLLFGYNRIKFGPQFSMVNFKYKEEEENPDTRSYETTNIYPFFTMSLEL